jgi:exodeoxyribonuclease VII large subunit
MSLPAADSQRRIFSVSEINRISRQLLEDSFTDIWIEGEVSNLRVPSSGHMYFALKDAQAEIAAVIFRSQAALLKFHPENGLQVTVNGRITLYEPRGLYQISVQWMEPRGRGALYLAFEQLKQKLAAEGLFEAARKRPIPALPRRVGIVTSPSGAALRDILRVLERRHAGVSVLLAPARVQGEGAAQEIAEAVGLLNEVPDLDVLIVGRGGGSIEDLWPFNEEVVARAIAASRLPVISAVGHEIDVTIADWVADLRAPTPSAAAEMVVASRQEMLDRVAGLTRRLEQALRLRATRARSVLDRLRAATDPARVRERLERVYQRLDELRLRGARAAAHALELARGRWRAAHDRLQPGLRRERLRRNQAAAAEQARRLAAGARHLLERARTRHAEAARALQSLSPLQVLERGYALCVDPRSGALVRAWNQVEAGAALEVRLGRGSLGVEVRDRQPPADPEAGNDRMKDP